MSLPYFELTEAPDFTASTTLKKAADLLEERGKNYDSGHERSMAQAVGAFNCITGLKLTETQGWLFMQCVKLVRQQNAKGFHQDSYEDDVAYAALKTEAAAKEASRTAAKEAPWKKSVTWHEMEAAAKEASV